MERNWKKGNTSKMRKRMKMNEVRGKWFRRTLRSKTKKSQ